MEGERGGFGRVTSEQRVAVSYCSSTTFHYEKRHAHDTSRSLGRPSRMALMGMRDAVIAYRTVWPIAEEKEPTALAE